MMQFCTCSHLENAHEGDRCRYCARCEGFEDGSNEYTADLLSLGETALKIGKKSVEQQGTVHVFFVFRDRDGKIIEQHVPEKYGPILNSDQTKTILFSFIREQVKANDYRAVVITAEAWMSMSTKKGAALGSKEFEALYRKLKSDGMEAAGYSTRGECVVANIQTPEQTMILTQRFERIGKLINWCEISVMQRPADEVRGRQKMFGDLRPENVR